MSTTAADRGYRREKTIRPPSWFSGSFREYWRDFVQYRDLLLTLSVLRIKVRYKQSILGISWAVLHPLALMAVYVLIFSVIAHVPSEGVPYALFVFSGLLPWTCFSSALSNSANALVNHAQWITRVYFPREIIPITYVVAGLCDFVIAAGILAVLMVYYGVSVTANIVYVVPIMIVLTGLTTGLSLIVSAVQVRIRDLGVAMPLLLQLCMFGTPIVYPLSAVPERLLPLYRLNPLVGIIENFRRVVLTGQAPELASLAVSAVIAAVLIAGGYTYFKHTEGTLADVI